MWNVFDTQTEFHLKDLDRPEKKGTSSKNTFSQLSSLACFYLMCLFLFCSSKFIADNGAMPYWAPQFHCISVCNALLRSLLFFIIYSEQVFFLAFTTIEWVRERRHIWLCPRKKKNESGIFRFLTKIKQSSDINHLPLRMQFEHWWILT